MARDSNTSQHVESSIAIDGGGKNQVKDDHQRCCGTGWCLNKNRMRSISAQLSSSTPSIIASLSYNNIRKDSSVIVIGDATEAR